MFEALENFQQLASHFQRQLLGAPGLVLVLVGLCVWLAGLRWRKLIAAVVAALFVGYLVKVLTDYSLVVIASAAAVAAVVAAVIEKIAVTALAILLGVFIVLTVFAWPTFTYEPAVTSAETTDDEPESDPNATVSTWPIYEPSEEVIPAPEAIEITVSYLRAFADRMKNAYANLSTINFASAGFTAILIIIVALVVPNFLMSVTFSLLGTILIAKGMFLLLLYKGSEPITLVAQAPEIYGIVFVAMVAFGTLVQMLLQKPLHKPTIIKKQDDEGEKK